MGKFNEVLIPKKKLELLERLGVKEFEQPMTHYVGQYLLSREYIIKTPIDILERDIIKYKYKN